MHAVVSSVATSYGYIAYPVAYFAEKPPAARSLSQSWARKEHWFSLGDGRTGWDITTEAHDYELAAWIKKGKLHWLAEGKISLVGDYPFQNLKGRARPQVIFDDALRYQSG